MDSSRRGKCEPRDLGAGRGDLGAGRAVGLSGSGGSGKLQGALQGLAQVRQGSDITRIGVTQCGAGGGP